MGSAREVRVAESRAVERTAPAAAGGPIPASPPPEVLEALDTAARVLHELAEAKLTLQFEVQPTASGKRVSVKVRDGDGDLVREIPARRVLDLLAGEASGLAVDERG